MKKIVCLMLVLMCLLCGCNHPQKQQENIERVETEDTKIRGVWIYYDELSMLEENGGTADSFTKKISAMLDKCVEHDINTVFVQVRPFCDAFYSSKIFPTSYYLSGQQGKAVEYDALKICVDEAHSRNLSIHAWLNPFRVMYNFKKFEISSANPAYEWIKNDSRNIITTDEGIFMCPASSEVQSLVIDGVREIAENYDIDGIHIDDYFYPTTDESADSSFYEEYIKSGGKAELDEWRRTNISALIASMYSVIKSADDNCIFSISPQGNISNNLNSQYADVNLWCTQVGFADWIIPQVYYSFDNSELPFEKAVADWSKMQSDSVKLIWGLALYRLETDFNDDEIDRQLEYLQSLQNYNGCVFFSYSQLDMLAY